MAISSSSSSVTLVTGDDSSTYSKSFRDFCPKSPYGIEDWTQNDIKRAFFGVLPSPRPQLMMMQMIADAYEDRRRVWECNKDRERGDEDDLAIYGPINKAQKKIEDLLVHERFLSGPSVLETEILAAAKARAEKKKSRASRHPQEQVHSKPSKISSLVYKYLKLGRNPQVTRIRVKQANDRTGPEALSLIPRPILPVFPRIDPGYEHKYLKPKTLRRVTWEESDALRVGSVRKRKPLVRTRSPRIVQFYCPPKRLIPTWEPRIQHDDFKYLPWTQLRDHKSDSATTLARNFNDATKSEGNKITQPSVIAAIVIYLLIQFTILVLIFAGLFAMLWALVCAIFSGVNEFWFFFCDPLERAYTTSINYHPDNYDHVLPETLHDSLFTH